MWVADNWKDYEVLDTSAGEKLERWKQYILLRPDPQVIWNTKRTAPEWKRKNAHYHRSSKGGGQWEFFDLPEQWTVQYELKSLQAAGKDGLDAGGKSDAASSADGRLTFHLKPFSFKHTGLFPEQAANWEWFAGLIAGTLDKNGSPVGNARETAEPIKVLNLFAYTGGATVAAAKAGAHVTHVDASKGMVQWAKENAKSSGVEETRTRWIVDDCKKFVEREIRRGNKYDAIIMDPPSYGRGPKGEIWKMEDQIFEFLNLAAQVLKEKPLFFLINSYTTGLQPAVLSYMLNTLLVPAFGGTVEADEIGLPVRESGLILPCGASGRWKAK